ncbi:uncharacterized protein At4g15545 isoform X2 [Vigna radiata var. radiata]|uniref:Uncharacterized protein At4g15545 isoform X2 n=1 Tax=Vigna radiata var. radiata TaxID=3916 RepID=A0A3Q0F6Y2_VIGRR|nr:uncharacterized protein At4g15545 isoform X2 [Vigna radiata var. radiata]
MWLAKSLPLPYRHVSTPSNQSCPHFALRSPTETTSSPTFSLKSTPSTPPSPKLPTNSSSPNKIRRACSRRMLRFPTLSKSSIEMSPRYVCMQLEVFRKTLMQSLQEEDDNSGGAPDIVAKIQNQSNFTSTSQFGDNDASLAPSISSSTGNSLVEEPESDAPRPRVPQNLLLASQGSTPRITPPGSPPNLSASVSPTRTSKPVSPRRHSVSFSTTRGMFDDRSSVFSSSSLTQGSISTSDAGTGSQTGRTRVDGKEFFRQVRNRLSYEQFGAFLANVKELNSHKQTKEETLRKADEIFGPENNDLYNLFEGLINRNVH